MYYFIDTTIVKNDFVSSGRAVSDLKAHLVLTAKYRRKVFDAQMLQSLTSTVLDLCRQWDCKVIKFSGEADHIHLLFQYYPQLELPKFVSNLKSVFSGRMRTVFKDKLETIYRGKAVVWNASYFIAICGGVTISILQCYIEQQDAPC